MIASARARACVCVCVQPYGPPSLRYDRRPQHRSCLRVRHCSPTDRLLSVTTSSTPCWSPGGTLQSYGPPPLRYDVLNTLQVPRWDIAVLRTASSPLRRPQHRAGLQVGQCSPTDRLLSVTTSSTPCRSPSGTMQSYRTASSPFYGFLNTVQVSKRDIEPRSCVKVEVDVLGSCP